MKEKGIPIATTVGLVGPWAADGGRTLTPWGFDFNEAVLDEELDRVRRLWDSGVTVAFGTDTPLAAGDALALEIDLLSRVFSPEEIVRSLTVNAAEHLGLGNEVGTLTEGQVADLLLVGGDPLTNASDLANVVLVVQRGAVVVDNR